MQIDDSPPDAAFLVSRKVKVKLTVDGTNIGKHLHIVNFAFTILEEEEKAHSAAGNHCVAIFKATENYDDMKLCLLRYHQRCGNNNCTRARVRYQILHWW